MRLSQIFIVLGCLIGAVACQNAGVDRPGRGRFCRADSDPIPVDTQRLRQRGVRYQKISMDFVSSPQSSARPMSTDTVDTEVPMPAGTYVYTAGEFFWNQTTPHETPGKRPRVAMLNVVHRQSGGNNNRSWSFENSCVRFHDWSRTWKVDDIYLVTRFEATMDGTVRVLEVRRMEVEFTGNRIVHRLVNVDDISGHDSLRKVYAFPGAQFAFFRMPPPRGQTSPFYEIRAVTRKGNDSFYRATRYQYFAPNVEIPADKLLP